MHSELLLPGVPETTVHLLVEAAEQAAAQTTLVCNGEHLTYPELMYCVAGFARELEDLGVRGERVALVCGNGLNIVVAMFAAQAAGAQVVPLNPHFTPRELTFLLEDADPRVVVYEQLAAANLEGVMPTGCGSAILVGAKVGKDLTQWRGQPHNTLPPLPTAEMLASLQYTGGTTGLPKGVNSTHANLMVNVAQREAIVPTPMGGAVLSMMPLFHVFGIHSCLHSACYRQAPLVILERYHPEAVLDAIARYQIRVLPAGPTVFNGLLAHEKFSSTDFSSLELCISGSAPLPEVTLRAWESATGCPISEGYGQSEAGPVLTFNPTQSVMKPGSVGIVVPECEVQIVDADAGLEILKANVPGEIRARGPQIMPGYRNRPEETAQTLRDGWLYTGDIGELDDDGYLYILDRKKDMVIVGGYNVYPREIDEILISHPQVLEAAAVGVADAYRGERVEAYVVAADGQLDTEELLAHCRENLVHYKVPSKIHQVLELPKTTVGKIDKKSLRAHL